MLRTVETDGAKVAKIALVTAHDGEVWHTWYAPFGAPDELCAAVEGFVRSLEQEWPTRVVPIALLATSHERETLSRLPMRVTGKAKTGSLDSATAATGVVFDNLANTIEKLQRLTNTQLDAARRTIEQHVEQTQQYSELIKLYRERETLGGDSNSLDELVAENAGPVLGMLAQLIQHQVSKPPSKN
jgi:hypothetical protein